MHTNQEDDDVIVLDEKIKKKPGPHTVLEKALTHSLATNAGPIQMNFTPTHQVQRYGYYTVPQPQQSSQQQVSEWMDVNETVTVVKKVRIPAPQFKGKILGKGGETIKALRRHYNCDLYVHGAGSLANAEEETERLNSGDPRYQHFTEPLHIRIKCTGTAPEVYANIGGVTQILAELFNGQVAEVNLEGKEEAASSNQNGFSNGHRASYHQQQGSERYFSNTSYTPIPPDQRQSTSSSIPAVYHEQSGSGRGGGYVHRGGVGKRDRGDSGGYHSHRGGGRTSDVQGTHHGDTPTPTVGRGGGGGSGFSTSFRGRGGGGGGEFATSSHRGGGNRGLSTSSSSLRGIGRGGGH